MDAIFSLFADIAKFIFDSIASLIKTLAPMVLTVLSFILWVLSACIILPCIFVAGTLYPKWEKWGESF